MRGKTNTKKKVYQKRDTRVTKQEEGKYSKGKGDRFMPEETVHKYNDVSWYAKNQQMLTDAASFSYNSPLGNPVPFSELLSGVPNSLVGNDAVAGVAQLQFVPCIGISTNSISPANIAANNIYSYVRYMNSGAKNYDQADMMLYLLAMDNLYMYINWMKRIYGYVNTYSQYNKYVPAAYAAADSVDIADLRANLADFRLFINNCCARASAFCVPAVMPLFVRHSWMVSNIYKDSDTLKAQSYMYVPSWFYKYDETGSKYGGQLIIQGRTGNAKLSDLRTIFESMFSKLAYSEDIGVMSGDILKAYGQERLFKLSSVDPDYTVLPVYNEEVLSQIHNLQIVEPNTASENAKTWNVTQDPDTGYLVFNPTVIPWAYNPKKIMVNMPWDGVTPADTMVATRLTAAYEGSKLTACGSELITKFQVYKYNTKGVLQITVSYTSPIISVNSSNLGTPAADISDLCDISQFD